MAEISDLLKLDIRVGKIIDVKDFPEAKKPMYIVTIDFGEEIGLKKSCAQLKKYYTPDTLNNKMILGVVNFPPRQIGPQISEVLLLGVPDEENQCVLLVPDKNVAILGGKIF